MSFSYIAQSSFTSTKTTVVASKYQVWHFIALKAYSTEGSECRNLDNCQESCSSHEYRYEIIHSINHISYINQSIYFIASLKFKNKNDCFSFFAKFNLILNQYLKKVVMVLRKNILMYVRVHLNPCILKTL